MSAYRYCRWCHGSGCISCPAEAKKAYEREFPRGPELLASFDPNNEEDMAKMRGCIGIEILSEAFGDGGGGIASIKEAIAKAGKTPDDPYPYDNGKEAP